MTCSSTQTASPVMSHQHTTGGMPQGGHQGSQVRRQRPQVVMLHTLQPSPSIRRMSFAGWAPEISAFDSTSASLRCLAICSKLPLLRAGTSCCTSCCRRWYGRIWQHSLLRAPPAAAGAGTAGYGSAACCGTPADVVSWCARPLAHLGLVAVAIAAHLNGHDVIVGGKMRHQETPDVPATAGRPCGGGGRVGAACSVHARFQGR